nr:hypothetical protein [Deltaproteobacteria bacterium]
MDQIFESHFGGNQSSSNGGEVEGYCPKCRADTQHIILESYGEEIRRVQCAVCGDTHAYKPPRGGDDDNPETVAAAKRRGLKKPDWLDAMNLFDHKTAVRYSPRTRVKESQIVVHPTFGVGYVSEIVGEQKVEVKFRNNLLRVLVHGRGTDEAQLQGDKVDEEEVKQLLGLEMGPSPEEIAAERERKLAEEETERQRVLEEKRQAAERERQAAAERREQERLRREQERERKRQEREEARERK